MDSETARKIKDKVKSDTEYWDSFLDRKVEYGLKDSKRHTKGHVKRVILFALMLADMKKLNRKDKKALAMAAVFHDSRRQDDLYDVGHGDRAAEYYKTYAAEHGIPFDERTYLSIKYHDRPDASGYAAFKKAGLDEEDQLIYQLLKDADGLDRMRISKKALDLNRLRTEEGKSLYDFALETIESELGPVPEQLNKKF